jgi:hypothetical protein
MVEPVLNWLRAIKDPLRSPATATRWIAQLPVTDVMAVQAEALDLVTRFPGARTIPGPAQVEALLQVDARLEPVIVQLTQQYTANYQKSTAVESRLWHSVFDLVKAFTGAYNAALKAGYPRADHKRWQTVLPWLLVRLMHFKGLDGKFRLFRYGHWIPSQWRELHELLEFARQRGWQQEQLPFGAGAFARPGATVEEEYLKTLLLMRLDSGNFTPDQVDWVARQLEVWAPALKLVATPSPAATFFVDLSGSQGLRRPERPRTGERMLFVDSGPVYTRIVERMRALPEQDSDATVDGELPSREQRLVLMRLAALYGPDAIAHAARATRHASDGEVRVVTGLAALTRAIAEVERVPDAAGGPSGSAGMEQVSELVHASISADSMARRIRGSTWKMEDRSDTGCRLTAPGKQAPGRLGEIIAMREGDTWALAVVRRMQRHQVDEATVGVEVVGRRLVRVLLRSWSSPSDSARPGADRPFFGVYLPAHPENRQSAQRSLIGPDDKFVQGGMIELDTGSARYLIRLSQTLERQAGWAWVLFSAVRKLSA